MNAIHIIMATSGSANPHTSPNIRIESLARKRKISAVTFLIFGMLLIIAGSLLASFERQRFSVSFIVFGVLGIIFAFMYWISAEKILIALRKLNAERLRQARFEAQNSGTINFESMNHGVYGEQNHAYPMNLPTYEQSVYPITDVPPSYDEVIKVKNDATPATYPSQFSFAAPIHSISLLVAQADTNGSVSSPPALTSSTEEQRRPKRTAPHPPTQ